MKKIDEFQLKLMLQEWRSALMDTSFVSDLELSVLMARLIKFVDHHQCPELDDMIEDVDLYQGG